MTKRRPFDKEQLSRRTREVIEVSTGRSAWIYTPEDIVLAKLYNKEAWAGKAQSVNGGTC